jgi:hypothetical protein
MNDTKITDEMKCLSLIEVMELPRERREIALGTLRAIKERDEARTELEMWRDGNIMHQIHKDELEKAERERDEAREAADNLVEYARQSLVELEKWGKGYARYERQMNEIRAHIARVNWKEASNE